MMRDAKILGRFQALDIFDTIRDGYKFVAARASHVSIREDRLKAYALSIPSVAPDNTLDDHHHFTSTDPETLAAYVLTLESVNFGSGFEDALIAEGWPRIDNSIYYTIAVALKQSFETYGPWNAEILRRVSVEDMHNVFLLPRGRMGRALAAMFALSMNEMGEMLVEHYDGSFLKLIESAHGRAAGLVSLLARLPAFADIANYHGRDIPIMKRAQHGCASLNVAFGRIGRPLFGDIERLTIFADNGIPMVLRVDGVLEVTPDLERKIETGAFLTAGSEEEIELRACAAEAMERLAAIKGVPVLDLDYQIWHRSVEDPRYKQAKPHRTISRYY
jgi:hypothetical protein